MAPAARSFSKCFSPLWVRACFSPWVVPWQPRGGAGMIRLIGGKH